MELEGENRELPSYMCYSHKILWFGDVGWSGLKVEALNGLSMREVQHLVKDIAWRKVREGWREEASQRLKLEVIGRLMDGECMPRCVEVACKRQRRMLVNLRGGTAELRIETGRWSGLSRDEQICKNCDEGEVEDGEEFLLRCACVAEERMGLERVMNEVVE